MAEAKVIKNASQGYGYKYSSLADLADAGVDIPKMRVKPTEFGEFIEYLDKDGNWQIGAKIVEFEAKGMNRAQMYGSALTYARRYTVQMAEQVACDDDKGVESSKPVKGDYKAAAKPTGLKATDKQVGYLITLCKRGGMSGDKLDEYIDGIREKTAAEVSKIIEAAESKLDKE